MRKLASIIALLLLVGIGTGFQWLSVVGSKSPAAGGNPTITLGVHNHTDNGNTSSATAVVAMTSVTTASGISCEISFEGAVTLTSVADPSNGTYAAAVAVHKNATNNQWYGIYYVLNAVAGTYNVTLTTGSGFFSAISCQEWKGMLTASALDGGTTQQLDGSTSNPTTGSALTPGANGEVCVANLGTNGTTPTAGANYALIDSNTLSSSYPEYWIQTTATATNAPYTNSTDTWTDQQGCFK